MPEDQLLNLNSVQPFHAYCLIGPVSDWPAIVKHLTATFSIQPADQWLAIGESTVTIDQIRQFEQFMKLLPYSSDRKLAVLNARALSQEAANALLKSVEEPRSRTIICLFAQSTEEILPTLWSRCQIIRFRGTVGHESSSAWPTIDTCQAWSIGQCFRLVEKIIAQPSSGQAAIQLIDDWLKLMYTNNSYQQKPQLIRVLLAAKGQLEANVQVRLVLENIMLHLL